MPDPADRRNVLIRPTHQVNAWIQDQLPALKSGPLQSALQRAAPDERESLANAVARLRALLEQA